MEELLWKWNLLFFDLLGESESRYGNSITRAFRQVRLLPNFEIGKYLRINESVHLPPEGYKIFYHTLGEGRSTPVPPHTCSINEYVEVELLLFV